MTGVAEGRGKEAARAARRTGEGPFVLTAADVAAATGGALIEGDATHGVAGFSIDSRTLVPGDLFFAIRGKRQDGHTFMREALAGGACGLVVSRPVPQLAVAASTIILRVDDVVAALQRLARHVRRASGSRVVAVTGSAGKTTTKEIAADLLEGRYRVFRSRGNLNNEIGLPLSLLELRHRPDVAVVELAMSRAGEISTLVALAEPDIRVWTNVGLAHAAHFASAEAIADAKAEILEGSTAGTVLVANAADSHVMARVSRFPGRLVTFGVEVEADVSAVDVRDGDLNGTATTLRTPVGRADVRVALVGRGHLANVLAAVAVAIECHVPLEVIVERISSLRTPERRGEVIRLPGGVTVIDDTYNSNPEALRSALEVLGRATGYTRKVAVVGEMLELGAVADAQHVACGEIAAATGLAGLVTVGGPPARMLGEAAVRAGLPAVQHAPDSDAAAALAVRFVRPGDLVLVKGSRGVRTERVVDRLRVEFA